ncbi:hypothetical protein [Pseudoprimorskyibacter insulae]|uniref:Nucleotide-diphospho-sugar transferase domain-containing protein n=1 Tax=Pseudoprimorskyibacter insulae TaxID=1695997 RepID=A0A2R8AQL7_9RHOB|nr:hypothetical protein [Pseudoprimorskyibacter insulae]SPF78352.1 hypothetical protein PRI8871_00949 [Pseudoprimorskyibacter insulae]
MPTGPATGQCVNILIVGQHGRLQYEAALFAASFARLTHSRPFRLFVAEPQPSRLWDQNPRISDHQVRELLKDCGATILPFENRHFGASYPHGNKIEALFALPAGQPFVFFDSDTLVLDDLGRVPFDFDRPSASLRCEGTWPKPELYGPGLTQIWKSLYDRFDLDFESSLDLSQPDDFWRRYLYFNAGFFYYRCPQIFGAQFLDIAVGILNDPPRELLGQTLDPWLDQIALPLTIHALGGGRDALAPGYLDGDTTCHYRLMPLLFARESDRVVDTLRATATPNKVKRVLKNYDPFKRMIYQNRGQKVRDLFDQANLPRREQAIRNRIKREGLWIR